VDVNDVNFNDTFPYVALPNTTRTAGAASTAAPGASPSLAPRASTVMGMPSDTIAVLSACFAGGLGLLLFFGWWRRRNPSPGLSK
jgi:hypothetical protein